MNIDNKFKVLRQKAEDILKLKGSERSVDYVNDIEMLVAELSKFQLELELQNQELHSTNRKLIAEQEKYCDLYQNAPIAYFTLNKTGNIFDVNNAAAEMLKMSIHAFNKTSIFPYLDDTSKNKFNQFFTNVFSTSKVERTQLNFINSYNETIYTEVNAQSYFDYNLRTHLCRCAVTDITQQKKFEQLITNQNELLNLAFDNDKVAWWDWNYETGEVKYSPNKATMLGYTVSEFPVNVYQITELIHHDDYEHTMQVMEQHLRGLVPFYEVTYRIKTKSGDYIYFYDYGKIIERTQEGKPKRINGIVFNISQQKQIEIELQNERQLFFEILQKQQRV